MPPPFLSEAPPLPTQGNFENCGGLAVSEPHLAIHLGYLANGGPGLLGAGAAPLKQTNVKSLRFRTGGTSEKRPPLLEKTRRVD
jgi:hypothetical protein